MALPRHHHQQPIHQQPHHHGHHHHSQPVVIGGPFRLFPTPRPPVVIVAPTPTAVVYTQPLGQAQQPIVLQPPLVVVRRPGS